MYNELQSCVDKSTPSDAPVLLNRMQYYVFSRELTRGRYRTLCKRLCAHIFTHGLHFTYRGEEFTVYAVKGTDVFTTHGGSLDGLSVIIEGRFLP